MGYNKSHKEMQKDIVSAKLKVKNAKCNTSDSLLCTLRFAFCNYFLLSLALILGAALLWPCQNYPLLGNTLGLCCFAKRILIQSSQGQTTIQILPNPTRSPMVRLQANPIASSLAPHNQIRPPIQSVHRPNRTVYRPLVPVIHRSVIPQPIVSNKPLPPLQPQFIEEHPLPKLHPTWVFNE